MRFLLGLQGRSDYLQGTELLQSPRVALGQAACSHSFGGVLKMEPLAEARGAAILADRSAVDVMHHVSGP